MEQEHPLIVVLGPTASGKTALALRIAQTFDGEIVNFDSIQAYRYFNIGSGKVSVAERGSIPHHLLDIFNPSDVYTAGEFAREARRALGAIVSRNRIPVLVGGTGFYLRALLQGLSPGRERNESVREQLLARESKRRGSLHRILTRLDPVSAGRIHSNDVQKLIRALELCILHRTPASAVQAKPKDVLTGFRVVKAGLDPPRAALCDRINARVSSMFEQGLLEEVRSILERGVPPLAKPFESLGYSQALACVNGQISLDDAIRATRQETRRYAKRQMTWFRREPDVQWFAGFGDDPQVQTAALSACATLIGCKTVKSGNIGSRTHPSGWH